VQTSGKRVLIVKGDAGTDAITGAKISPLPDDREDITVNNRLRRAESRHALAALNWFLPTAKCA
jgi:hypothetical protein